jgi:hypothetical protein
LVHAGTPSGGVGHNVWPSRQVQIPLLQVELPRHGLPHEPQLELSVLVLTHTPLHIVSPVGQAHDPLTHVWPLAHDMPHDPQLELSV